MLSIRIETERFTVEIRIDAVTMGGLLIQVMMFADSHLNSTTLIT